MGLHDARCPYCGLWQDINHDDGYGFEENEIHNQQCSSCEKYFTYTTSICFSYDTYKANCLNGSSHIFKPTITYPKEFTMMECIDCGERRKPTEKEMIEILKDK